MGSGSLAFPHHLTGSTHGVRNGMGALFYFHFITERFAFHIAVTQTAIEGSLVLWRLTGDRGEHGSLLHMRLFAVLLAAVYSI